MNFKKVIISTICISSFMFTSLLSYADEVNLYDEYQEVDDSMELMEYITNSKSNISISSKGLLVYYVLFQVIRVLQKLKLKQAYKEK